MDFLFPFTGTSPRAALNVCLFHLFIFGLLGNRITAMQKLPVALSFPARQLHDIIMMFALVQHNTFLLPPLRNRILKANIISDLKFRQWLGMKIVTIRRLGLKFCNLLLYSCFPRWVQIACEVRNK